MQTSDTTKELTTALCQFQSAQLKATKKNTNPAFKTKYSGINEVLEAVLPTLTEVGLCFVQFPDGESLTTRLMHTSGEWMQASYALKPAQNTPQASGSALTYARRYALLAVLGLGTEDDDGTAGSYQPAKPYANHTAALVAPLHATPAQRAALVNLVANPLVKPAERESVTAALDTMNTTKAALTIDKITDTIAVRADHAKAVEFDTQNKVGTPNPHRTAQQ